jgi:phage related protein|nr:MAG TPA: NinG recombination protein [Caudoviricetes sp.]
MTAKFLIWLKRLIADGNVHPFYISAEWRKVRKKALEFYHYECQDCKKKTPSIIVKATMVHHKLPLKKYPQYALSLFVYDYKTGKTNAQLIPLCHTCHEEREGRIKAKADNSRYPERW